MTTTTDATKLYVAADGTMMCKTQIDGDTLFFKVQGDKVNMAAAPKLGKAHSLNPIPTAAQQAVYMKFAQGKVDRGMNINDVDVPDIMRLKMKTGVEWFDKCADHDNPGFTPSTVMLFTAAPGCGKSTMMRQIADACTQAGHIALYNAGEESIFQVKLTCERLDLPGGFIVGADGLIDDVLEHGRLLMKKNPGKQLFLFLDSLATLNDGKYRDGTINSMTSVRVMKKIVEFCKETFAIAIVIGHVNKKGQFAGKQQLKHDIDAHAHMKFVGTGGKREFKFTKNRFASIPVRGSILMMTANGLVLVQDDADLDMDGDDDEEEGDEG